MYAYMYICVCVCIHTSIHVYMYKPVYMCMSINQSMCTLSLSLSLSLLLHPPFTHTHTQTRTHTLCPLPKSDSIGISLVVRSRTVLGPSIVPINGTCARAAASEGKSSQSRTGRSTRGECWMAAGCGRSCTSLRRLSLSAPPPPPTPPPPLSAFRLVAGGVNQRPVGLEGVG